ncbi:MAG: aminopeptidase [Candidatus Woesearchaeota archaeon]|nr:aminopeptidase [Candidatus Woesearchaeota archaeon]
MPGKPTQTILKQCINLRKDESLLVVADSNTLKIGKSIFEEAKKICKNAQIAIIPVGKVSGEEPPDDIAEKMKGFDVIIAPTTKSLTHTNAIKDAAKNGARVATLPGITEEVFMRDMSVDYPKIARMTKKLHDAIRRAMTIRIFTDKGTDISIFRDKGSKAFCDDGIIRKKGMIGNLPGGELFFVPQYAKTEGVFVVDASIGDIGLVDSPVRITVKKGYAVSIEGKRSAQDLMKILESCGKEAYNIAELGIGTNKSARISGVVLEDEKVYGTAHIALGSSKGMGGKIYAGCHLDCVFKKPTIYADGKMIMREGSLTI